MMIRLINRIRKKPLKQVALEKYGKYKHKKMITREFENIDAALSKPGRDDYKRTENALKKCFGKDFFRFDGLPEEYIDDLASLLVSGSRNSKVDAEDYDLILSKSVELEPGLLSLEGWKNLCHLTNKNGLFRLGGIMRNKAVDRAYQEAQPEDAASIVVTEAFKAAVDQADFAAAERMLSRMKKTPLNIDRSEIEKFRLYFSILKGDKEEARALAGKYFTDNDKKYSDYLKGKTVAVVGPAPTDEALMDEIDSYDLVIRINYRGRDHLPDPKEFGTKLNVSYYNGTCINNISKTGKYDMFNDLDFAVFKSLKYSFQKNLVAKMRGRILFPLKYYRFYGTVNMVPATLYDLVHFEAARIKLFKVNFYLSKTIYHEGYSSYKDGKINWGNLAGHNPVTQINITRHLWKAGQIEVDNTCKNVLSLSNDQYLSGLEAIYTNGLKNDLTDTIDRSSKKY